MFQGLIMPPPRAPALRPLDPLLSSINTHASFKSKPEKGQADGYARELWRRLRQPSYTCSSSGSSDSSNGPSSSNSNGNGNSNKTKYIECDGRNKNVHALLEASLRCRHQWLCREAFREASLMMGRGDGAGLPRHPRELTALLFTLQRILSAVFEADEGW